MRLKYLWTVFVLLIGIFVGLFGGVAIDRAATTAFAQTGTAQATQGPNAQLIDQAWSIIQRVYVDRAALNAQTLTYGAISGMVNSLGDTGHSTFLTPAALKSENQFTQGQFEGIGAEVEQQGDHVVIVAPMDNSPAQKAGLKPGDIIVKVNGEDVTGQPIDQVIPKVLGPAGTTVKLTIMTPSTGQTRDVTLTRARINIQNVTWSQIPGTTLADVRIAGFSQGVTDNLKQALQQIQQQHLTGIVLDLRNNPGGLLDESVGTTSQFVSTGNVLLTKDAQGRTTPVPVESGGVATNIPMVILVNNGTASASEIVAGALQDDHRAELIGSTTFGTGTVLNQFQLSDGSALLLATEEWLTPAGRVIWHHGITPDKVVTLPTTVTPVLPDALKSMSADQLKQSDDVQMLQAIQFLGH